MLPIEYGSGSTCHRRFQQWNRLDAFKKTWIKLLKIYDNKNRYQLDMAIHRQYIHKVTFMGGNDRKQSVDRSKLGTKRHILTDKKGIPLSAVISSASTHDINLVTDVVDSAIIRKEEEKEEEENNTYV